jgi:processive 1,2-diacylglycerol beta-glucosyltransferase
MAKKRIILMYISEISGHHNATLALEKALNTLSPDVEVMNINAFKYTNPISEKVVNRLYMAVIKKAPRIWDYLYDNPEVAKKLENIKNTIHKFNSPKLKNLFDDFKPDVVACTQAFPCGMVADYKKTYNSNLPLVAVLTDYIPHAYWIYDTIDYYVVPSEDVGGSLAKKGVPPEKIKPFGIPFDLKFNMPVDKTDILRKFKLDHNVPNILIMGGGHGLGPIKTIIKSLEKVEREIREIIITGNNTRLYKSLKRGIKKCTQNITLFRYVNNIHEFMSVSSLIITKPGGITIAESMAKKLPMIIIKPIPGQETSNTIYLTQKNAAIKIDKPKNINQVVEQLLNNPQKLERLSESAKGIAKPNASLDTAKLLLKLCDG